MGKVEYIIQHGDGNEYPLVLADGEQREVLVLQEEDGKADFNIQLGDGACLNLTVITIACGSSEGKVQAGMCRGLSNNSHITAMDGKCVDSNTAPLNICNTYNVNLNSPNAECNLNGVYLVDSGNKVTNKVDMNHNVGHCVSNQLFRGILWDSSRSNFEGRIYVAPDAQKTEAYQANNNMVESLEARAHTQPHLEIYADDVKCSHGATVGNKESGELFYMQSRGISPANAKVLLKQAFLLGVLEKISDVSLKEEIGAVILSCLR